MAADDDALDPPRDPSRETVTAATRLARVVAGDDDALFLRTFQAVLNAAETAASEGLDPATQEVPASAPAGRRAAARRGGPTAGAAAGIPSDSVYSDPVFLTNARAMLSDRRRIVGGIPARAYADCVAVGTGNQWCCTGTLVAPNVVVTAGHCERGGCGSRIFVGTNVDRPSEGRVVKVKDRAAHAGYKPPRDQDDIAVLVLEDDVTDVTPRPIASAAALANARSVRVVGYGYTDTGGSTGYGLRRLVDVPLAGNAKKFGGDPRTEFVAGAPFLDKDSCNGDSGGPAYVNQRGRWLLAGATSRATSSAVRPCGDGGIYTTVDAYRDWITGFMTDRKPARRPRGPRR
jgi:secreted trypsin-like serine protease